MPTRLARLVLIVVSASVLAATPVAAREPSPSAAPSADQGFPAGYVVEQVEPGVFRIISDGYRDLSSERGPDDVFAWGEWSRTHESRHVVAAPDGSVWVLEDGRMFEVGAETVDRLRRQPPVRPGDDVEIAPDGTVWRVGIPGGGQSTLRAFDGRRWTRFMPREQFCGVEVQRDDRVWATWSRPFGTGNEGCRVESLGRWDGQRWTVFEVPRVQPSYGSQFAVTGRNDVWICCRDKSWSAQQRLVRFDGRRFTVAEDPAPQADRFDNDVPLLIDGSADGTLWLRRTSSTLARHNDSGWTVFTAADGVPQMGWVPEGGGFIRAAPGGSVWVSTTTDRVGDPPNDWPPVCDGVSRFDGATWSHYLAGMCVLAIDIASDGTAWVQAALADTATTAEPVVGDPVEPVQTFAIRPGAET